MIEVVAALMCHQESTGGKPLGISRATWLRNAALDVAFTVIPVIDGQTIWSAGPEEFIPVVEQPNWFGRSEKTPPLDRKPITLLWWEQAAVGGGGATVVAYRNVGSVAAARNLAGRLRQIPGVVLPHGQPTSPWFVVSLPSDAGSVAEQLHRAGFAGCHPLGAKFPEFPGGMRIEVAWSTAENEHFAELVQRPLGR